MLQCHKDYHSNGKLWCKYYTINGKKEGEYLSYNYRDGKLNYKCYYVNNKKEGKYLQYYRNGQLCCKYYFENDELIMQSPIYEKTFDIDSKGFYDIVIVTE